MSQWNDAPSTPDEVARELDWATLPPFQTPRTRGTALAAPGGAST